MSPPREQPCRPQPIERISTEVTNGCAKGCWFCYAQSTPAGQTVWTPDELLSFARDCAAHGVCAVSFGGGEPLEYDGLFEVLAGLRGSVSRSFTTNGLLLSDAMVARVADVRPDKVHVSVHFPGDVTRVIAQVKALEASGIPSGVNLLVARSQLREAAHSAYLLRDAGIGQERIVDLPMRGRDTPSPSQVARVAGGARFSR